VNDEGQTPLSAAPIDRSAQDALASLWITSVEELVALNAAVAEAEGVAGSGALGSANLTSAAAAAGTALPQSRLASLTSPQPGGALGCLLEREVLAGFERYGRVRPAAAKPIGAFEAELPPVVRLLGRMPPVRGQGERGTCVAFGTVALREFLVDCREDLSEQFLYWACKELDGVPGPGTYLHTAMTALAEYGVCEEATWPYNPLPDGDEGQGPPPPGAIENAKRYRLSSTRTVEPNLVVHYKNVLGGEDGEGGMPVSFATLVFNSWYRSPETHRTGKITLPLPGERPVSGHAWCVVGYVDDEEVPGGGYFIVRNSWGIRWAPDSPEAPGHAMMPYEYVKRYAVEAFTGPTQMVGRFEEDVDPTFQEYVRTLTRDERDVDGKLLRMGARVLCHPSAPEELREDTPQNRQEFLRLDFAWTDGVRQRVWFPDVHELSNGFRQEIESVRAAEKAFASAIDDNMLSARKQDFPIVHLPWWFSLLPYEWEPKVRQVEKVADLSGEVTVTIGENAGGPQGLAWPQAWSDFLGSLNKVTVYRLGGKLGAVHVVAAYVTRMKLAKHAAPEIVPPGPLMIDAVLGAYRQWQKHSGDPAPGFAFLTLGSCSEWPQEMAGSAAGDHWVLLSDIGTDGNWKVRAPPRFADRLSLRNFLDRLKPETCQQRVSRVKHEVDGLIATGFEGNIHVERITKATGYRRTAVREAMLAMQESGHYRLFRMPDNRVAIRRAEPRERVGLTSASFRRSFLRRHALRFMGAAVGAAPWLVRDLLALSNRASLAIFLAVLYIANQIQSAINRRASEDKE